MESQLSRKMSMSVLFRNKWLSSEHFNGDINYFALPGIYAETRPIVLWTGKTKCGRVFICLDW